jgi:uncharacterized protein YndB with AHSA1/START domain
MPELVVGQKYRLSDTLPAELLQRIGVVIESTGPCVWPANVQPGGEDVISYLRKNWFGGLYSKSDRAHIFTTSWPQDNANESCEVRYTVPAGLVDDLLKASLVLDTRGGRRTTRRKRSAKHRSKRRAKSRRR